MPPRSVPAPGRWTRRALITFALTAVAVAGAALAGPPYVPPAQAEPAAFYQAVGLSGTTVPKAPDVAARAKAFWSGLPPAYQDANAQQVPRQLPPPVSAPGWPDAADMSPFPAVDGVHDARQAWPQREPLEEAGKRSHYRFYFVSGYDVNTAKTGAAKNRWIGYGGRFSNKKPSWPNIIACYREQKQNSATAGYAFNNWKAAGFPDPRDKNSPPELLANDQNNNAAYKNLPDPFPSGNFYEYDIKVNPYTVGSFPTGSRGAERLVRDAGTGEVYYTSTHYCNFTPVR